MSRKKRQAASNEIHLGFQIAPMIDVVFVIMLFFMVMAGQVQKEQELNLKLPGTMAPDAAVEAVEETQIRVLESGEILLNEDMIGAPDDRTLKQLTGTLIQLKTSSDVAGSKVVCTIVAEEFAPYQRVIDTLNSLSAARIQNVTFEVPPQ